MNKRNVKVSIRAVTERKNFDMSCWFVSDNVQDIDCGTAACIGGCTALTPEFKAAGGFIFNSHTTLRLKLNGMTNHMAMAEFWDIHGDYSEDICINEYFYDVDDLQDVTRDMALKALNYLLENETTEGFIV